MSTQQILFGVCASVYVLLPALIAMRTRHSTGWLMVGCCLVTAAWAATAAAMAAAPSLHAKPFKWASAGEISTWDIHSQNNALQNGIHAAVYESLVYYNSRNFKIEPVLATSWNQVSPTQLSASLWFGKVPPPASPGSTSLPSGAS